MIISPGATSISLTFMYVDDSGLPLTGKVAADMPTIYYARPRAAKVAIPLHDLSAITDAFYSTAGNYGFFELGGGKYRLDIPNAAFATACDELVIFGEASGKHFLHEAIQVADAKVGTLAAAALAQLEGITITITSPTLVGTTINPPIIRHRDYSADDSASIDIAIEDAIDFTGATCYLTARTDANSGQAFRWTGSIVDEGEPIQILRFQPTAAQTAHAEATYEAQAVVVLPSGHKLSPRPAARSTSSW